MACLHGENPIKTKAENPILRLIGKNYCKESSNDEVSSTGKRLSDNNTLGVGKRQLGIVLNGYVRRRYFGCPKLPYTW